MQMCCTKGFFRELAQDFVDQKVNVVDEEMDDEEVNVLRDRG